MKYRRSQEHTDHKMIRMLFLCEFTGLLHRGDDTETADRIS